MSRRNRSRSQRARKTAKKKRRQVPSRRDRDNLAAFQRWFLDGDGVFAKLKFHGNSSWSPSRLVWLAVLWAWSERRHLTDAFTEATEGCRKVFGASPLNSYQGFLQVLARWASPFLEILWSTLHARMQEIGGQFWRMDGWLPIAFDGSRSCSP